MFFKYHEFFKNEASRQTVNITGLQVRDGNALTELEDCLVPHLRTEPLQRDLLRQLLVSMNEKCDTA